MALWLCYWKCSSVSPLPIGQLASSSISYIKPSILGACLLFSSYQSLTHTGNFNDTDGDSVYSPCCSLPWGSGLCWYLYVYPSFLIITPKPPKPSPLPFHLPMNGVIICLFAQAILFLKLLWHLSDYLIGLAKGRLGWKIRGQGEGKSLSIFLSIPSLIFILFPSPSLSNTLLSYHRQCLPYTITPITQHHWHHSPLF